MKRRSSLRGIRAPMPWLDMCAPPLRAGAVLCGGRDGLDDVMVAGAAAQVAVEIGANRGFVGMRDAAQQIDRGHDHAGGAESALQRMILVKSRLHRMKFVAFGEALDGGDLRARRLRR